MPLGRRSGAKQVLQTLLKRPKKSYVSPFDIALIYAAPGEKETAPSAGRSRLWLTDSSLYCFLASPDLAPCRGSSAGLTYLISHGPVPCNWITVSPLAIA